MVFLKCLYHLYPKEFAAIVTSNDNSSSANMDWLDYNQEVGKNIDQIVEDFIRKPEAKFDIEGKKLQ